MLRELLDVVWSGGTPPHRLRPVKLVGPMAPRRWPSDRRTSTDTGVRERPGTVEAVICPRCGTVAAGQDDHVRPVRRHSWIAPRLPISCRAPPVPRAPTDRGELAQRAAGIVPPDPGPPEAGPGTGGPSGRTPRVPPPRPPDPASRRRALHPGGSGLAAAACAVGVRTRAGARPRGRTAHPDPAPAPGWAASGTEVDPGGAPDSARSAAGWARAVTGLRPARPASRTTPGDCRPTHLWQSSPACGSRRSVRGGCRSCTRRQVNRRVQAGDMTGAVAGQPAGPDLVPGYRGRVHAVLVLWTVARGTPDRRRTRPLG